MDMSQKIKICEHCLSACKEDDTECHYCGNDLYPYRPAEDTKPTTIGEELTFYRFSEEIKG